MDIKVLTLFPEIFEGYVSSSIFFRAVNSGKVNYSFANFRDYSQGKYKKVDDEVYGGGAGMLLKPEPLFKCLDNLIASLVDTSSLRIILPSASGVKFNQKYALELSKSSNLIFICGHYEGVDQRVIDKYVTDEICIGDYVLTSGELSAMVIMDAVVRQIDGVISADSLKEESFTTEFLEYPQYTRPATYCNLSVPDVLLNGNHKEILSWRRAMSIQKTLKNRPDLLKYDDLSCQDKELLKNFNMQ